MAQEFLDVTGGVDTHRDVHVAALVDQTGRSLVTASFPATQAGYERLVEWMRSFGRLVRVGVEGTGSYGAGLAKYLTGAGVEVVEVNRPNRQRRRSRGKSDTVDAQNAALAALSGQAATVPKSGDGLVEGLRCLSLARRSAVKARTQAGLQIRDLIVTAPPKLRAELGGISTAKRAQRCARLRPAPTVDPEQALRRALKHLGRRYVDLTNEIVDLDRDMAELVTAINPALAGAFGVGTQSAAALLITAGDNPQRLKNEAAFAALCGVSPLPASSGKIVRHRLNRGGDRQANSALWRIALIRMTRDDRTQSYVAKRTQEGKTRREIMRCLQRYIAREIHSLLVKDHQTINGTHLRLHRQQAGLTLANAAGALGTWPIAISRLERGIDHNTDLATTYQNWLKQQAA